MSIPSERPGDDRTATGSATLLVYRQNLITRITHWLWAICLFFLLFSGLQIFNARPTLYVGQQSGFDFDNSILSMTSEDTKSGPKGYTTIFGHSFDTSGWLGMSPEDGKPTPRGFPSWATIPAMQDLATGRVIHFFFAWLLVFTLFVWLVSNLITGHLWRDIVPGPRDVRRLPRDILNHLRLRFQHARHYNSLQKLSYALVLLVLLPLMILTGLCMSPGMDAVAPWIVDLLGRQTARTVHFFTMATLLAFFLVHIVMVFAAGPINEMRSIITDWYRNTRPTNAATLGDD
jgi:thiosulfate reductase cytochrome b subunit